MKKLLTENEIYEQVKEYIENKATKKELTDMLMECIDNYQNVYKDLHLNHVQYKNKTL